MSDRTPAVHPSSFRDPSGFIFTSGHTLYRQVNQVYRDHYDQLMNGGLYKALTVKNYLITHSEVSLDSPQPDLAFKIIQPEQIPFPSWPYEWPFDMLKDAALLTLRIAMISLEHDMILKDATPYNVQWNGKNLVFIDTLSFEKYEPGRPWIAYRQFCETFLAPLLLMHHRKISLQELQLAYPEGIPLAIASRLLPWKSRFSMLCYLHIHLHAKLAAKGNTQKDKSAHLPREKQLRLLKSLEMLINSLKLDKTTTTWGNYYGEAATRDNYLEEKENIISSWLNRFPALETGVDMGANDGHFTRLLSARNISMIAIDADPKAIGSLYMNVKSGKVQACTALIINLANPSPAIGLNNNERSSFLARAGNRDIGLCLALIHHLFITYHIPFGHMARMFQGLCKNLIIEFVPVSDPKVREMLGSGRNLSPGFDAGTFEYAFTEYFSITDKKQVDSTGRMLYLMEKKRTC